MTTQQMARKLGVSERRVRQLAKARKVGKQLADGTWLFSRSDIQKMERRVVGRPHKG